MIKILAICSEPGYRTQIAPGSILDLWTILTQFMAYYRLCVCWPWRVHQYEYYHGVFGSSVQCVNAGLNCGRVIPRWSKRSFPRIILPLSVMTGLVNFLLTLCNGRWCHLAKEARSWSEHVLVPLMSLYQLFHFVGPAGGHRQRVFL